MPDKVSYERLAGVSRITLDDGKVNSLSPDMIAQINGALDQAEADGTVVCISGRAGRFSAGFDLKVFERGGDELRGMLRGGALLAERLLSFPRPTLIACNGHALAMGAFLLTSVDVRIGAQGAFKIGLNEVAIGMTVPHFGIELARHRLAPAHFDRALNTAHIYTPDGAVAAGFLDEVVAPDELGKVAEERATALAALDGTAHVETKRRSRSRAHEAVRAAIADEFDA